jgi:hypothetical protein
MLAIRVGKEPNHVDFGTHESFLTSRSDFFRRAMNGNWTEADTRVVKLPEDDPNVFGLYLDYVYTGQLTTMEKTPAELAALEPIDFDHQIYQEYEEVFRLFVLAKKLQDVATKNAALAAAIAISQSQSREGSCTAPSKRSVHIVYVGTPAGSLARRLVADMWSTLSIRAILIRFQGPRVHNDFLEDLAKATEEKRPLPEESKGNTAVKKGVQAYLEEV